MQKAFLFLLVINISINAKSQITKGNWLLGGDFSFSQIADNSAGTAQSKISIISLTPNIGFFIFDKFSMGLRTALVNSKEKYFPQQNGSASYGYTNQRFSIGPYARYYILPSEKVVNIFIDASYQLQTNKNITTSSTTKESASAYFLNAGPVIFLNTSVGIEFSVGYSSQKYKDSPGRLSILQTSVGLQIHLEKDK